MLIHVCTPYNILQSETILKGTAACISKNNNDNNNNAQIAMLSEQVLDLRNQVTQLQAQTQTQQSQQRQPRRMYFRKRARTTNAFKPSAYPSSSQQTPTTTPHKTYAKRLGNRVIQLARGDEVLIGNSTRVRQLATSTTGKRGVVVNELGVQPIHARIVQKQNGAWLYNIAGNHLVRINNHDVSRSSYTTPCVQLAYNAVVTICGTVQNTHFVIQFAKH